MNLCFVGSDVGNIMLYHPFDLERQVAIDNGNGKPCEELTPIDSMCNAIGLSYDEEYLVTGSRRGTIKIFETKYLLENIYLKRVQLHNDKITSIGFVHLDYGG